MELKQTRSLQSSYRNVKIKSRKICVLFSIVAIISLQCCILPGAEAPQTTVLHPCNMQSCSEDCSSKILNANNTFLQTLWSNFKTFCHTSKFKKLLSLRCTVLCSRRMEERKFHHCIPRAPSSFGRKKEYKTAALSLCEEKQHFKLACWPAPSLTSLSSLTWFIKSITNDIMSMATSLFK